MLDNPDSTSSDTTFSSIASTAAAPETLGRIRVVVRDPSALFREGLARLLEQAGFAVVGCGETVAGAMAGAVPGEPPHILVCGIRNTEHDEPLREVREVRAKFASVRTVVLADIPDGNLLSRAAESEIDAVLSKNISNEVLRCSLELVMLGQRLFPAPAGRGVPRLSGLSGARALPSELVSVQEIAPVNPIPTLSQREDQILRFLASGTRNKLIAQDLGISEATVKFHIRALLRKLGAANRTEAAILGMRNGIAVEGG